jgi:hypothetical protein
VSGVADALRVNNQGTGLGLAATSATRRANLIFKACSSTLGWPQVCVLSLIRKYSCTVRHLGYAFGSIRHWQPLLRTYSNPQNTSYRSICLGLVFFRADSNTDLICSNCSRLMSLG